MAFGSGLGAPGTKVTAKLDIDSQLYTYIRQAFTGAMAINLVIALLMSSWAIVGWGAIPLVCGVACFGITLILFRYLRNMGDKARLILGNLWMAGIIGGAVAGLKWGKAISAGMRIAAEEIGVIFFLPWWVYVIVGIVLVAISTVSWKSALVALFGSAVGYIWMTTNPRAWAMAWRPLKWLLLPYLWPFIGFACLLALVMAKEMLFPNLEWTLNPVSFEEMREVGLFGLWLPRLLGGPREPPPVAERIVKIEATSDRGKKYATLPDTDAARNFYRAVKRGEAFSVRTAKKYQVGRITFNNTIRDIFLDRGWAEWRDDDHPEQGIELNEDGWEAIEHIVLTGTTPHPPTG